MKKFVSKQYLLKTFDNPLQSVMKRLEQKIVKVMEDSDMLSVQLELSGTEKM